MNNFEDHALRMTTCTESHVSIICITTTLDNRLVELGFA